MQDQDECKVTVHSNAHKLLFGDDGNDQVQEIPSKPPLVSKESEINKRKHRAPQVQKAPKQSSYSQQFVEK